MERERWGTRKSRGRKREKAEKIRSEKREERKKMREREERGRGLASFDRSGERVRAAVRSLSPSLSSSPLPHTPSNGRQASIALPPVLHRP
eukprot:scaffold201556_cov28-Tisochrysis_lutea.AAC.1